LCVRIEPVDQSFDLAAVDLSTVSLVSEGTGSVDRIVAIAAKTARTADQDGNGIAEIPACFARADLAALFGSIRGRQRVEAILEGTLTTGAEFRATLPLTLIGVPANPNRSLTLSASGVLKFTTRTPGEVTIQLFDVSGRLVRTPVRSAYFPAGDHSLMLDRQRLSSGRYWLRVRAGENEVTRPVLILR
jgi:hypothetical protein